MPESKTLNCPSCRMSMEKKSFDRKVLGTVELDLCFACRSIWFDRFESLQLEAHSVIELFSLINQHAQDQSLPLADALPCPRCGDNLASTMDRVQGGAFNYLRCDRQHGHFIAFSQFMIEKGFVRQLSGAELEKLKACVGEVRCGGCGATIDIRRDSACPYCHAPIALLDPAAVKLALAAYQRGAELAVRPSAAIPPAGWLASHPPERPADPVQGDPHGDMGDLLIDGLAAAWHAVLDSSRSKISS